MGWGGVGWGGAGWGCVFSTVSDCGDPAALNFPAALQCSALLRPRISPFLPPPPTPTPRLQANCAAVGGHLLSELRRLAAKHDVIGDVRGMGLMVGVELVKDRQTKVRRAALRCASV